MLEFCFLLNDMLSVGLVVLAVIRYTMLLILVLAVVAAIFSRKVTRSQKTGFWPDLVFFPLGFIYNSIASLFGRKKKLG